MNTKTTFAILLLAIALGLYFLVFETGLFNSRLATTRQANQHLAERGSAVGRPLFDEGQLSERKITRVRIERPDHPAVLIERDSPGGEWDQVRPVRFAMRTASIRKLLDSAADLRFTRRLPGGSSDASAEEMGLNPARAVLTLRGDGGEPRTLRLGRRAGVGRAYLAIGEPGEDRAVYIVNDALHERVLDTEPRQWRRRSLAEIQPGGVRKIRLSHANGPAITLAQRDGRWVLVSPAAGRADRAAVDDLIGVVSGANVGRFVEDMPEDLAAYGLANPRIVLALEAVRSAAAENAHARNAGGGKDESSPNAKAGKPAGEQGPPTATYTLKIGGPTGLDGAGSFAMYGDVPAVFTLPRSIVARLRKQADDLRDASLTPVARSDVREVTIERADASPLHLLRKGESWAFGPPDPGYELDQAATDRLLRAVFDTEADQFVGVSKNPPGDPEASVSMSATARRKPERLAIYKGEDGMRMVVRDDEATGYLVARDKLAPLFEPTVAYRNHTVLNLAASGIQRIDLSRSGRYPGEYHITRAEKDPSDAESGAPTPAVSASLGGSGGESPDWNLEGLEEKAVRTLVAQLTPLRTVGWVPGAAAAPERGEGITIRLALSEDRSRTIHLAPEPRIATVEGVEMPFRVSPALVDAASAELRDRSVLSLDAARIRSVESGGLSVNRDDVGRYHVDGGELSERKAAALYNALAGLSAEHYLDHAPPEREPDATFTVATDDRETYKVLLWTPEEGPPIARVGERVFTISGETAEGLGIKAEEPDASS